MSEGVLPICISGSITKAPNLSFCMDKATHLISYTKKGDPVRLKGENKEITEKLEYYTDAKCIVTVCGGYDDSKPECPLLIVSWIAIKDDFLKFGAKNKLLGDGCGCFST